MRSLTVFVLFALGLALTTAPLCAQASTLAIGKISPEAAAAGEEIVITGANMNLANGARFTANTGGFAGTVFVPVQPGNITIIDANTIKLAVPTISFVLPPGVPAGDPLGKIEIRDVGGLFSNSLDIFFMDGSYSDPMAGSFGIIDTSKRGLGSTNSDNFRAAASFTFAGGGPFNGNAGWMFTGDNMPAGSTATLLLGVPFATPFPLLDGLFAIDFNQPITVPGNFIADSNGDIVVPASLPATPINFTFTLMWVYTDAVSGLPEFTNGLTITI